MSVGELYLDGAHVLSEKEFHSIMSASLDFGPYYGRNLDALWDRLREGANKQVISSQADSLIKISRIWADFFPANTSNQPI